MRLIDADKLIDDYNKSGGTISDLMELILDAAEEAPPPNDPLTLEELQEMEERPVWIERHDGGQSRWAIVGSFDSLYGVYFGTARGGLRLPYDDYGKTWLAYRRRKENDEH